MRISYSEDEDFPGQFNIWQANCVRSLRGKKGQAALRRLEAALLAMPEKRLIRGKLVDAQQGVCALGQLARVEGKLPKPEPVIDDDWDDDDTDDAAEFGESVLKFPRLVAWKVVEQNDIQNEDRYGMADGPNEKPYAYGGRYQAGVWTRREITPEERYANVLRWVQENIIP